MAQTDLFSRLKRLFSTDVIIRNAGDTQLKIVDVNKIQQSGQYKTNSVVDRFNRVYSNSSTSLYGTQVNMNYNMLRPQLYSEYDLMDTDAIVATALDIIADESTLKNDMGEVLQIRSSDEDIQKILYNLFYDVLNIEFNLWSWIRTMCKYGDFFLKLEISEKFGIFNVIPYSAFHIERQDGYDEENPHATRYVFQEYGITNGAAQTNIYSPESEKIPTFENYEMAHFRLLSDVNFLPYGRSYLEPGRKLYKQYSMMEDAVLVHRIVRSSEKRIFYMNVGNIPPHEVDAFMEKSISKMKRTPYIDPKTGDYNLKYNMQNITEDFYIPVRGNDQATKIDTLPGLQYDGMNDVEYLRDKLFAALKVPKAFMGYEKDLTGKATLAAEDIRFARTIERIQRIMVSELTKIALVHLYSQGIRGEGITNFELSLTTPSIIYDQEKIALMKEKADLSNTLIENKIMPSSWIYENIWHLSEDKYDEYRDLIIEDAKRKFRLSQIEAEGNDPQESGMSYGTPHDLASMYGKERYKDNSVPDGYDDDLKLGRPVEKASNINTQDNAFGKDRIGRKDMRAKDSEEDKLGKTSFKGNSPLALERYQRPNKILLEQLSTKFISKKNIFTKSDEPDLLDDNKLFETDNNISQ